MVYWKIPEGVRLASDVPKSECSSCNLGPTDHTVNFSFPKKYPSHSGVAYQLVCLKDWAKYKKKEVTMPRDELKVNIIIKGENILIGAQATDCDPKMTTLKGDLHAALERIPSFVEEANAQWDAAPRNPKAPEPVAPPAPPRVATTAKASASKPAAEKPKTPAQPNFF